MADITFECPKCHKFIETDEQIIGKAADCPHCQEPLTFKDRTTVEMSDISAAHPIGTEDKSRFVTCPKCKTALEVDNETLDELGNRIDCPNCLTKIVLKRKPKESPQEVVSAPQSPPPLRQTAKKLGFAKPKCVTCGQSIESDAVICIHCGTNQKNGQRVNPFIAASAERDNESGAKQSPSAETSANCPRCKTSIPVSCPNCLSTAEHSLRDGYCLCDCGHKFDSLTCPKCSAVIYSKLFLVKKHAPVASREVSRQTPTVLSSSSKRMPAASSEGVKMDSAQSSHSTLKLWNPTAAVNWSVLFTPIFGAWLHAKNWEAMGDSAMAKRSIYWVYGGVLFVCIAPVLPDKVGWGPALAFLAAWYFMMATKQMKYVKSEFNDDYERKSWMTPILCGCGGLVGVLIIYFGIIMMKSSV